LDSLCRSISETVAKCWQDGIKSCGCVIRLCQVVNLQMNDWPSPLTQKYMLK